MNCSDSTSEFGSRVFSRLPSGDDFGRLLDRCLDAVAVVSKEASWRVIWSNEAFRTRINAGIPTHMELDLFEVLPVLAEPNVARRLEEVWLRSVIESEFQLPPGHAGAGSAPADAVVFRLERYGDPLLGLVLSPLDFAGSVTSTGIGFRDPLTGLPDRRVAIDQLRHRLQSNRPADRRFALLFIDLDGFKSVNDSLGHLRGDEVLLQVSQRLRDCIRGEDLLARFGGDEFVALIADVDSTVECGTVISRMRDALAGPIVVAEQALTITASVGVALAGDRHRTAEDLLHAADRDMYYSKQRAPVRCVP